MFHSVLVFSIRNGVNSILKPCLTRKRIFSQIIPFPFRFSSVEKNYQSLVSYCSLSCRAALPTEHDVVNTSESNSELPEGYPIFKNINLEEIAQNDDELLQNLQRAVAQMKKMAESGLLLPTHMNAQQWHDFLSSRSYRSRARFLKLLFIKEMRKEKKKERQNKNRIIKEEFLKKKLSKVKDPDCMSYGLCENSLFLRVYGTSIDKLHNFRVIQNLMFGPEIIIDCSYNDFMVRYEITSCVNQFSYLMGCNRLKKSPVNFHFVNFNPESEVARRMQKLIPALFEPEYPFIWSPKSYIDLFPKEKLVYLTPHCEETLDTVNDDDIYIIGGMVDKGISEPLSLIKAKNAGIRYAKLPLDNYVAWGFGTKSLTIDQCGNIVADVLTHGSWEKAFKDWLPSRKLKKTSNDTLEMEVKHYNNIQSLRNVHKRNIRLFEHILREDGGEKVRHIKAPWPA